tara:strand:+ start:226 stop:459 length:234 start_codon:yes stop_codon:yes gene_type:complete
MSNKSSFGKARPNFDLPINKPSTIMIYNLIRTNSLLSNLVERQNAEIEMQNLRIDGLVNWLKNKRKYTNKKFLRGEH